ncbi:hypothetical protein [Laceyella putida]|uniref:Uncharacterized protein n=1 Tax=Laceyella putida TaxID=110101 RepID=A0ABW2RR46_9BACL
MKRKLASMLFAALFVFVFNSETYASAGDFVTEDGKWDGYVVTDSHYRNVYVFVNDLYRVNRNSGASTYMGKDASALSVRLCSESSGNCTAPKSFNSNAEAYFTDMLPGDYYVDISDSWPNYYFKGYQESDSYS